MTEAIKVAIVGGLFSLAVAVVPKIIETKFGIKADIKEMKEDIKSVKEDNAKNSDMIYQMLDHMATNNNTGGMKKCLDEYNQYFRH